MAVKFSSFSNKLLLAVNAPKDHGKTESTQMLIDLLYVGLVTKSSGWKAEVYKRRTHSFVPYGLSKLPYEDNLVVFSYHGERTIAIVTAGDVWEARHRFDHAALSWQELLVSHSIGTRPLVLQGSLQVVVGCCRPNNSINKQLVKIAADSGYEMMETSPYYQVPGVAVSRPRFVWNYLFALDLLEIILTRLHDAGLVSSASVPASLSASLSKATFSQQMTPLVFAMMEDFRKGKDGFGFEERQKNNEGRKAKGLMFHGNDEYIRVSLSKDRADVMRTTTLGLEFIHDSETGDIDCMLEVVCDNSDKRLSNYKELVAAISPASARKQGNDNDRYLRQLYFHKTQDPMDAVVKAREFLQDHARAFRDIVKDVLLINKK